MEVFILNLIKARKMLINYLQENFVLQNNGYPKQDDWRNIVTHSFRVEKYTQEIANSLGLDRKDKKTVRVAAIFHDIGYCKDWKEHQIKGKEILNKLLDNVSNKDTIVNLVANHSHKRPKIMIIYCFFKRCRCSG